MDRNTTKKMAELLRTGNTMLNLSCPECNNPLFKNKNNITFCPNCNREIKFIDEEDNKNQKNISNVHNLNHKSPSWDIKDLKTKIQSVLSEKVNEILGMIKEENQIDKLIDSINLLKEIIELILLIS